MTIGIYKLEFAGTPKSYIGQSTNIEIRFKQHLNLLRKQEASTKLNEAYLKYGNPALEILCECTSAELNSLEAEAIEIFDSVNNGLNTCISAGGKSTLCGETHPNSTYSNEQVLIVLHTLVNRLDLNISEIAALLGVSKSLILGISSLSTHRWLETTNPTEYSILKDNLAAGVRSKTTKRGPKATEYMLVSSPAGAHYTVNNTTEFAKLHKLDQGHLGKLRTGERKSHKGWKLCPVS